MLADVTDCDELLKRHRDSQRLKHGWNCFLPCRVKLRGLGIR
jgi:hypothetical protein